MSIGYPHYPERNKRKITDNIKYGGKSGVGPERRATKSGGKLPSVPETDGRDYY